MRILRLLLFFALLGVFQAKGIAQLADSIPRNYNKWKPSLLRIGYDLARPSSSIFDPNDFSQEVSAEIDLHSFFLVSEIGFSTLNQPGPGYEADGFYYRVGFDANLIPYDKLRNVISFSFRYAGSAFNHSLSTVVPNDFGEDQVSISERGLSSWWLEGGLAMKVNVWKNLFIGYGFRLRFANNFNGADELLPAEIPGYGRVFNDGRDKRGSVVGFHYSLFWTIPFWDKPVPIKKVKRPKVTLPPGGSNTISPNQRPF